MWYILHKKIDGWHYLCQIYKWNFNWRFSDKSKCFHHTASFETTITNCHKLILIFFKTYFKKLLQKILNKGAVKTLTKIFFYELKNLAKGVSIWKTSSAWGLYKHFQNISRRNEAPFITKELSRAIMNRSKLKNRYTKWPSQENFLEFQKQRNICKNLNKKTNNNYFSTST